MAMVPLVPTQAMEEVMHQDEWEWPELLAAAEAITEQEYEQLSATPSAEPTTECTTCGATVVRVEGVYDGRGAEPGEPVAVQACRAEDRAMLATPAGAELVRAVSAALTPPLAVTTAPKRIWLQIGSDRDHLNEPFPNTLDAEVTWCADPVGDAEVEYVRADFAHPAPTLPDGAREAMRMALEALDTVITRIGPYWDVIEARKELRAQIEQVWDGR
jgi:hypothetical protein